VPGAAPVPGYGAVPPGREASPRRDRKRRAPSPRRPEKKPRPEKVEPDARSKLQQHARDKGWSLFWLEAMDPPQQAMSNANVTVLMLTRGASGSASSFGFLMSASRQPQKQKDRQRECARDLLAQVEQLIAGKAEADLRAWCQVPLEARESQNGSGETDKLKSAIATRLAATGSKLDAVDVEFSSSSCVLVSSACFDTEEAADVACLDFFSPDAAAQMEEAKRLGGLVRLKWHLSLVKALKKDEEKPSPYRPLALGVGFAVDEDLSRARAWQCAEARSEVLSEAMFLKPKAS